MASETTRQKVAGLFTAACASRMMAQAQERATGEIAWLSQLASASPWLLPKDVGGRFAPLASSYSPWRSLLVPGISGQRRPRRRCLWNRSFRYRPKLRMPPDLR